MKKIEHGLGWRSADEEYFENKVYAWIVNPKNTDEQYLVFELFEDEFYVLKRDSRKLNPNGTSSFLTDSKSSKVKTEKEVIDIVEGFRKKNFHFVVDWWKNHYNNDGLENVELEDLYDLCLTVEVSYMFNISFSLMKRINLLGKKKSEYKKVKMYSDLLRSNVYTRTEGEVDRTSNEELKELVEHMIKNEDCDMENGRLVFNQSYVLTTDTLYYIFLKSIDSRDRKFFNFLIKNIDLLSLDSYQAYEPFLRALKIEREDSDSYFIKKLMNLKKEKDYELNEEIADYWKKDIVNKLEEDGSKYSATILKSDFKQKKVYYY